MIFFVITILVLILLIKADQKGGSIECNKCGIVFPGKSTCLDKAVKQFGRKVVARRQNLVAGNWPQVPSGCSVQSKGDWAAHFNINKNPKQSQRIGTSDRYKDLRYGGEYTKVKPTNVPCPPPQCVGNYKLRAKSTRANNWGGGNSIFLDRHSLDCGNSGLNQFRLTRPRGDQLSYRYTCLDGINSPNSIHKNTGANDWGGGNTIFLDRHNVDCGKNSLSSFRLVRPRGNQLRYNYKCNRHRVSGPCRSRNTGWNQESRSSIYLDRHNVKCDKNELLTQFRLKRDGRGKFRYEYRCCKA